MRASEWNGWAFGGGVMMVVGLIEITYKVKWKTDGLDGCKKRVIKMMSFMLQKLNLLSTD